MQGYCVERYPTSSVKQIDGSHSTWLQGGDVKGL